MGDLGGLKSDSFWSVFGNAAGSGLVLMAGIVVARFLGKEIFGEYGMIRAALLTFAVFATFGLGHTATKFIAEAKNKNFVRQIVSASTKITLLVSVLFALFLFAFSKQIAVFLNAEHLSLALRILAVGIVFNAVSSVQIGILAGFKAFKIIAINNAIVGFVLFVLSVTLTFYFGFEGALSALLLASLFACVLNIIAVQKNLKKYPRSKNPLPFSSPCGGNPEGVGGLEQSDNVIRQMLSFSLPVALQEGMQYLTTWLQIVLLVKLTNYGEAGLFSAAHQWLMMVLFVPGVLKNVALSHLSGVNNNAVEHKKVFNRMVQINFFATLIFCLLVFALSGIISAFYGESFVRLPLVLNIAILSAVFMAVQYVYIQRYMSLNKTWTHFGLSTIFNVLTLTTAFFFIRQQPEKGAEILVSVILVVSVIRLMAYHLVMKIKI